jgi:hypothetical protein
MNDTYLIFGSTPMMHARGTVVTPAIGDQTCAAYCNEDGVDVIAIMLARDSMPRALRNHVGSSKDAQR